MCVTVYRLRSISNPSKFVYMQKKRAQTPDLRWVSEEEGNLFRSVKEAGEIATIVSRNWEDPEFINCELVTYDLVETGKVHYLTEAVKKGKFKEMKKELTPEVKDNRAAMLLKMAKWRNSECSGGRWNESYKKNWRQKVMSIILKVVFKLENEKGTD